MNRHAANLYGRAPLWMQRLLMAGFVRHLDRERYGGRFPEHQQLLAKTERFSRAELEAYQDERLREIVKHAYDNVPFYRRRFDAYKLTPADVRGRADLAKVPVLTRADIRQHFDELRSRDVSPRTLKTGHTSGTTGTPLTVGYDAETIWATYATLDRHYRWAGCRIGRNGDRMAIARGNVIVPLQQKDPPFWRLNKHHNQLFLSSFHLSKANLPAYFDALAEFRPAVVDGYPSTLYLLAKYLQSRGQTFPVRAATTSSETLYPFQRELIEERFACRLFDYYGAAERVVFSGECERHQGNHVAMEYGLAEVADEQGLPLSRGSLGKLIGTSLHNKAMPLIRYVTNDMSTIREEACSCGRGLELMEDVTTKAEDVLTLSDGRLISPSVLTHPFKPLDCIDGSQIVQTAPDAITVQIIPGAAYTPAHTAQLITDLKARVGANVTIDVRMVDKLDVSPNGKFKWVTSHVQLGI